MHFHEIWLVWCIFCHSSWLQSSSQCSPPTTLRKFHQLSRFFKQFHQLSQKFSKNHENSPEIQVTCLKIRNFFDSGCPCLLKWSVSRQPGDLCLADQCLVVTLVSNEVWYCHQVPTDPGYRLHLSTHQCPTTSNWVTKFFRISHQNLEKISENHQTHENTNTW